MLRSLCLSLALALAPEPVAADEPALEVEVAPASDPALADAQAQYDTGQARYETHDYPGAIESFTGAYSRAHEIEDEDTRDRVLSRLSFNLGRAHVAAYDVDGDAEHLVIARKLIADFRAHDRAQGRDPDADTDLQRLEQDLVERERARDEREDSSASLQPDPATRRRRVVGISLLAFSAPLAGLAVGGAVLGAGAKSEFETVDTGPERLAARAAGRTGDVLLGVGVGLAVLSAAAGATVLGLAAKSTRGQVAVHITPTGLMVRGAF